MSVPSLTSAGSFLRDNGLWLTALLVVAVFFGAAAVTEFDRLLSALASVRPATVATMIGLVSVGYAVRFCKWEYYLRTIGVDVPLRVSLLTFFSGLMLVVTPGKVGEAWKAWFLRDLDGVPVERTVAVVGAERVTDLLALTAMAALCVLLFERSPAVLIAVAIVFAAGIGLLNWRSGCLAVLDRSRGLPVVGAHVGSIRSFYDDASVLFRVRPLSVAMLLSLAAWGLEGIALWIVLADFGVGASPVLGVSVFGFGSVVGALSLLPGGLAATEASMVGVLVGLGYARPVAVAVTLVVRAGTLWYGLVLGTAVFGCYRLGTETAALGGSG